jgi:hypothetical protein
MIKDAVLRRQTCIGLGVPENLAARSIGDEISQSVYGY